MAGKIFVSYRRNDDPGYTQALYQRLEAEFAPGTLFMDIEGEIKPGDDFVEALNKQIADCDILLAMIGPRWTELLSARFDDPDDFVTIEIKAALDQVKRVIPVLVGGADMPGGGMLSEAIRALARRNAIGLRPERFKADCQGLITALREGLAAADRERALRTEAERVAAEAERRQREIEEAARILAAEERAKAQSIAGLNPEEIRKAEELANWDFIKERGEPQALRDHLARFPGGVTTSYAMTRLEEFAWAALGQAPELASVQAFLDEFPNGALAEKARIRLADLQRQVADSERAKERRLKETEEWGKVAGGANILAIEAFLERWPDGQYSPAARARIAELSTPKSGPKLQHYLWAALIVAGAGSVAEVLTSFIRFPSLSIIFLLAVLVTAVLFGQAPAIVASFLSFVVYNFFFIEPVYTFTVARPDELVNLIVFLVTAVITSQLAGRLRKQVVIAREQVSSTRRLYQFNRELSALATTDDIASSAAIEMRDSLRRAIVVLLIHDGGLTMRASSPSIGVLDASSLTSARKALLGVPSGFDAPEPSTEPWYFVPLRTAHGRIGVIGVAQDKNVAPLDLEGRGLVETLADQLAAALNRASVPRQAPS